MSQGKLAADTATIRDKPTAIAEAASYRLEESVGHLFRRAHQRGCAIFQAQIGDEQITTTQFAAMVKLRDLGELSQNHLGRLTAMDPATTQGVMRRLLDRKLIGARSDPNDRRRTLLSLSADGAVLIEQLVARAPAIAAAILEPLDAAERATFIALLKRLC
jgi:MarR family transcriptional regulator, lower aerobic nicotinate degradation pathway regulator